jgi:pantetheine-phosphate adenylyltransferase
MKRTAVYAGSFDPITNGHMWMITTALKLFDKLVILIATNPQKKYMFDVPTRSDMIFRCLDDASPYRSCVEIHVLAPEDYVVDYAKKIGAGFLLRGVRTVADFDYEKAINLINMDIELSVQTVFLMPPRSVAEISSSMVKGLIGPKGWADIVERYVPLHVRFELEKLAKPAWIATAETLRKDK